MGAKCQVTGNVNANMRKIWPRENGSACIKFEDPDLDAGFKLEMTICISANF